MKSTLRLGSKDPDDASTQWQRINSMFRSNVRGLSRAAIGLVLLLTIIHIFFAPAIEWLNTLGHLSEPSLASLLALVLAIMVLEKVFAIEDELLENRNFLFAAQDDLYRRVIDDLLNNHISATKVIFLQHSGQTASLDICKLVRNARETEVVLYQQAPQSAAVNEFEVIAQRIKSVNAHLAFMDDASAYRSRLKIKRYISPASIRAMMVDDKIIVLSWYVQLNTGAGLRILGSENTGLYITRDAKDFSVFHDMIRKSIEVYDQECKGRQEPLSANVTLCHC